jgi:hypothetical protein
MYKLIPLLLPRLRLAMGLGVSLSLLASAGVPAVGTVDLSIRAEGKTVQVELSAAPQTLVGFSGAPVDADQKETLKIARENLMHGEVLVRFNPQASCLLDDAKVDAGPQERKGAADLGASYRFHCTFPQSFKSAALGLFVGFPAVQRAHVRYTTAQGQGAAELTPGNPVVNFIPLQ